MVEIDGDTKGGIVCLTVLVGDLGTAHAALDPQRLLLVLSPHLDRAERAYAARRTLARAGQEQPRIGLEVICLCGLLLDLTLPILSIPSQRPSQRPARIPSLDFEPATVPLPRITARAAAIRSTVLTSMFRSLIPGRLTAPRHGMSLRILGSR